MSENPEMDMVNQMFKGELQKFKNEAEATKMQVVQVIAEAGALDWLIEVTQEDEDEAIRAYADLATRYREENP